MCQAVGWFFGLFGFRRDGKFAKCLKGMIMVGVAVFVVAGAFVLVRDGYAWCKQKFVGCDKRYCYAARNIWDNIYFHDHGDGKGFVYNRLTGERLVEHVAWIAEPYVSDSLVCFSDGKKRGYFSKYTGRVIVEPRYDRAWIFCEGMACVEENGQMKFIDGTGKVVIDKGMTYNPLNEGYLFHHGYCRVNTLDGDHMGLMDKAGNMVLPQDYSYIFHDCIDNRGYWIGQKEEGADVFDQDMNLVLAMTEGDVSVSDGTINVTMPDNTVRKYDMEGSLISDFYIGNVYTLEYEKDEIIYQCRTHTDEGEEYVEPEVVSYRPKAIARLRSYTAGRGKEGLMTADGHIVTMPLYDDIQAIGPDLYLCTTTDYDCVVVNGKGEVVR